VTPLAPYAIPGFTQVVRMMVETMAVDKQARDKFRWTPMDHAANNSHEDVVQMLVETAGAADKDARDNFRWTPVHHAADKGHELVVQKLVQNLGADTEACDILRWTPLHNAADKGRVRPRLAAEQEKKRGDFRALIISTFGNYQ
jgi:ankyrin repeat protein